MAAQKDNKNIKYINRDFNDFKNSLIEFAKTYYPDTYNDFSKTSPGMMFIEMSAYVGDVLSFYLDNQIQETFIQYARQTDNLFELAYMLGYKPKVTAAATTTIDFYQQLPAIGSSPNIIPDFSYTLNINENTTINSVSDPSISFITQDKIDFSFSSSLDPTEISVLSLSGTDPSSFLLKKSTNAISATIKTTSFSFGIPESFPTITINDQDIIKILDVIDSDGNIWYEVSHLAQDSIFDSIKNNRQNSPNCYQYADVVPSLLQTKSVQRRFATRFLDETTLQIQFGSGFNNDADEEITPNPDNVGLGLPFKIDKLTTAYSPTNFIFTNTYGISPSNTTLTIRYLKGGGINSNVPQNDLNDLSLSNVKFNNFNLNSTTADTILNSLAVTNPAAASGGQDGDNTEEIRQNSMSNFQSQLRTVTSDDYLLRTLSLPSQFGTVSKAYIETEKLSDLKLGELPSTLNLYVLSYNNNKNLTLASQALKQNIKTYLSQYKMINDSIRIKDAFIVNIEVLFEIIILPNYNNNEVILNCVNTLKTFFNIDEWQINEPIILRDIYVILDRVEGVQTVKNIKINNKTGSILGYSDIAYDVEGANINGVVYPSLDPCIFEVKYPDTDIKGRCVGL